MIQKGLPGEIKEAAHAQAAEFEPTKSTKGASKMRRDLINAEISNLRDLLPLPPSTRQRLSQLQLMALVCVYVRKMNYFQQFADGSGCVGISSTQPLPPSTRQRLSQLQLMALVCVYVRKMNYFQQLFKSHDLTYQYQEQAPATPNIGFSKAMNGFMMMMTQNGKLLYISENAAEYLGHSMEDLLIHGDSVYDIIDRQDHQTVQQELNRGADGETENVPKTRHFFCRMNVSRNARRQMRFGDQKVVLVRGHFVSYLPLCSRNEPVFVCACCRVVLVRGHFVSYLPLCSRNEPVFVCACCRVVLVRGHFVSYLPLCSRNEPVFVCACCRVVLVRGHFVSYLPLCSRNEPVFVCACCRVVLVRGHFVSYLPLCSRNEPVFVCACCRVVLVRGHFVSYLPLCSRNEPVFVCACCRVVLVRGHFVSYLPLCSRNEPVFVCACCRVVLVRGHFVSYLPLCSRNEPVFVCACCPLAMPETRECVVLGATNVFTTVHAMDMKILHVDTNGEWYLGWKRSELTDVSWYQLLHCDSLREAQAKHRLITQSEQDKCCILLARLQRRGGGFLWAHIVLQVKEATDTPRQLIVATNQVLSEEEATIMMSNSWLYQFYGYQNQPCGMLDPRCQKFFRREPCYQDPYQESYPYVESVPEEYPGYMQGPSYTGPKVDEGYMNCEKVYSDRGPVDYSTHSPQSTISEERSPHHYEPAPELVVHSNMFLYPPHAAKRDYYDYQRYNYATIECATTSVDGMEYPSPKRSRPALEGPESMDRWNPSPPWSESAQRYYYHMAPAPPVERAMVT
ncbi:unnamed protein product [Plutella xylostella]|uniref:(diamondback moth) hypothetical protein n=1 Tax=Plutella xylostella TaxID=51655 RepID=A0A8S4EBM7_PLUXY|nr:unnamed protein product [Plutella xylostella]